jgi:chaperonin GroEL
VTVKDLAFAFTARNRMLSGVEIIANAVQVTLGPKGRTVALGRDHGTKITKDGVSVAREIELDCQFQRAGAKLVRSVALKASKQAGDGTTTAIVLSKAIARGGVKAVEAGINPMDLRRGINSAVEAVVAELARNARRLSTNREIAQIATISANGDRKIGEIIASAVEQVGADGVIKVEDGTKLDTELEVVRGIQFNRSYISPRFITDRVKRLVEMEDAFVLLSDTKLTSIDALVPLLEKVVAAGKPLLIVADDFEPEVRAALVVNKLRGGLKVVAVKSPAYAELRKLILDDIALMTGGTVFSESLGVKLRDFSLDRLGRASKVTVDHQNTMIAGGEGNRSDIDAKVAVLRRQLDAMSADEDVDYDRDMLQQRIATLSGGIAFVRVGGTSEVDVRERVDRIRNAVNATRAAAQEGISPGGGVALLRAGQAIRDLKTDNDDQNAGIAIVRDAVAWPARQIALNAGEDASVVLDKILKADDGAFGYDAQTGEYGDMFAKGIIEPVKVVRTALQCAASVAGGMMTTEVIVAERPGPPPPEMPGHDHHDDHDINFEW